MDTLTAITTRRSVRNYANNILTQDELKEIIHYWLFAPSAHNQQAWKYYIISKKEDHIFLSELMEFGKMLANAWWVILACYDKNCVKSEEFIPQDMGASIQTVLLAAHDKGIGSVWLGLYPHKKEMENIAAHFKLEENIVPFALISLGKQNWNLPEKTIKDDGKIGVL